jgi:branched-chain amino acid transport system ATP-binding protein
MALLSVQNVTKRFGGIVAVDGVSLDVAGEEIVGLIGPNGAGKTTLFNLVTGIYRLDAGDLVFMNTSLLGTAPHRIAARGIARTFQNVELFPSLTVLENVLVGAHSRDRFFAERRAKTHAREALRRVELEPLAHRLAGGLPFGTLKRIELARALAARPQLLLLDEPAGGLNHEEVDALATFIRRLRDELELTVLLVEHHMNLVMSISDHVHVLDFGRKIAEGTPAEVARNQAVIEAYLGVAS